MTGFVVSKTKAYTLLSLVAAVAVAGTCFSILTAANAKRRLPIYRVENAKRQIALTFDAAWTADDVSDIIGILARFDAPSTFFAVGDWAAKYPDAVKALAKAGHELGNHSASHTHLNKLDAAAFRADVERCNRTLSDLTGKPVTLYRGPYGEYNDSAVAAIEEMGMYYIQWDCDSRDWKPDFTVQNILDSALKNVAPGSILLLHVGAKHTVEALPILLERLQADGYTFVTVSDLILKENYTIDHAGEQHPA